MENIALIVSHIYSINFFLEIVQNIDNTIYWNIFFKLKILRHVFEAKMI